MGSLGLDLTGPLAKECDKRPDLFTTLLNGDSVLGDVALIHPIQDATRLHRNAKKAGAAAKEKEEKKYTYYDDACRAVGIRFIPLVFETYGRPGGETVRFMKEMVRQATERLGEMNNVSARQKIADRWWKTFKEFFAVHHEVAPPSAVDFCLCGKVYQPRPKGGSDPDDILLIRANCMELFVLHELGDGKTSEEETGRDRHRESRQLILKARTFLNGRPEAATLLRSPQGVDLLVTVCHSTQISVARFDPDVHDFRTVSLHSFHESIAVRAPGLSQGEQFDAEMGVLATTGGTPPPVRFASHVPPLLRPVPGGLCRLAARLVSEHIVLMDFRASSRLGGMELHGSHIIFEALQQSAGGRGSLPSSRDDGGQLSCSFCFSTHELLDLASVIDLLPLESGGLSGGSRGGGSDVSVFAILAHASPLWAGSVSLQCDASLTALPPASFQKAAKHRLETVQGGGPDPVNHLNAEVIVMAFDWESRTPRPLRRIRGLTFDTFRLLPVPPRMGGGLWAFSPDFAVFVDVLGESEADSGSFVCSLRHPHLLAAAEKLSHVVQRSRDHRDPDQHLTVSKLQEREDASLLTALSACEQMRNVNIQPVCPVSYLIDGVDNSLKREGEAGGTPLSGDIKEEKEPVKMPAQPLSIRLQRASLCLAGEGGDEIFAVARDAGSIYRCKMVPSSTGPLSGLEWEAVRICLTQRPKLSPQQSPDSSPPLKALWWPSETLCSFRLGNNGGKEGVGLFLGGSADYGTPPCLFAVEKRGGEPESGGGGQLPSLSSSTRPDPSLLGVPAASPVCRDVQALPPPPIVRMEKDKERGSSSSSSGCRESTSLLALAWMDRTVRSLLPGKRGSERRGSGGISLQVSRANLECSGRGAGEGSMMGGTYRLSSVPPAEEEGGGGVKRRRAEEEGKVEEVANGQGEGEGGASAKKRRTKVEEEEEAPRQGEEQVDETGKPNGTLTLAVKEDDGMRSLDSLLQRVEGAAAAEFDQKLAKAFDCWGGGDGWEGPQVTVLQLVCHLPGLIHGLINGLLSLPLVPSGRNGSGEATRGSQPLLLAVPSAGVALLESAERERETEETDSGRTTGRGCSSLVVCRRSVPLESLHQFDVADAERVWTVSASPSKLRGGSGECMRYRYIFLSLKKKSEEGPKASLLNGGTRILRADGETGGLEELDEEDSGAFAFDVACLCAGLITPSEGEEGEGNVIVQVTPFGIRLGSFLGPEKPLSASITLSSPDDDLPSRAISADVCTPFVVVLLESGDVRVWGFSENELIEADRGGLIGEMISSSAVCVSLYRDETGGSVFVCGSSWLPFTGRDGEGGNTLWIARLSIDSGASSSLSSPEIRGPRSERVFRCRDVDLCLPLMRSTHREREVEDYLQTSDAFRVLSETGAPPPHLRTADPLPPLPEKERTKALERLCYEREDGIRVVGDTGRGAFILGFHVFDLHEGDEAPTIVLFLRHRPTLIYRGFRGTPTAIGESPHFPECHPRFPYRFRLEIHSALDPVGVGVRLHPSRGGTPVRLETERDETRVQQERVQPVWDKLTGRVVRTRQHASMPGSAAVLVVPPFSGRFVDSDLANRLSNEMADRGGVRGDGEAPALWLVVSASEGLRVHPHHVKGLQDAALFDAEFCRNALLTLDRDSNVSLACLPGDKPDEVAGRRGPAFPFFDFTGALPSFRVDVRVDDAFHTNEKGLAPFCRPFARPFKCVHNPADGTFAVLSRSSETSAESDAIQWLPSLSGRPTGTPLPSTVRRENYSLFVYRATSGVLQGSEKRAAAEKLRLARAREREERRKQMEGDEEGEEEEEEEEEEPEESPHEFILDEFLGRLDFEPSKVPLSLDFTLLDGETALVVGMGTRAPLVNPSLASAHWHARSEKKNVLNLSDVQDAQNQPADLHSFTSTGEIVFIRIPKEAPQNGLEGEEGNESKGPKMLEILRVFSQPFGPVTFCKRWMRDPQLFEKRNLHHPPPPRMPKENSTVVHTTGHLLKARKVDWDGKREDKQLVLKDLKDQIEVPTSVLSGAVVSLKSDLFALGDAARGLKLARLDLRYLDKDKIYGQWEWHEFRRGASDARVWGSSSSCELLVITTDTKNPKSTKKLGLVTSDPSGLIGLFVFTDRLALSGQIDTHAPVWSWTALKVSADFQAALGATDSLALVLVKPVPEQLFKSTFGLGVRGFLSGLPFLLGLNPTALVQAPRSAQGTRGLSHGAGGAGGETAALGIGNGNLLRLFPFLSLPAQATFLSQSESSPETIAQLVAAIAGEDIFFRDPR
uniref:Uncharacterized protein n=1 Tax=Chromera velia CCMP2878 TaxID=1169474 RepID=A0A0G4HRL1_9ALVE|eukprot:Cvel_8096.t1-p1 / transcript=Cvel_8096.t1 / gene=Cvel_8096 / organism=Chromera_velia_CCMP2878 / gene_product=hypothetical protein / transcript_product=hypothetical protein / location=Cvel_scaffold440:2593-18148(+) / protein_length=2262 / sequence_SO=supercontig / SO=protein_coding / is_pseudo=false